MDTNETTLQEFNRLASRVHSDLLRLAELLPETRKEMKASGSSGEIRLTLAAARGIRTPYANFIKAYSPLEETARMKLGQIEEWEPEPEAQPAPLDKTDRKGTPKYQQLRAQPGWPKLINPEKAARIFGETNDFYFLDQPCWPAPGSFDAKAFLMRVKFEKWAGRAASSLHHLCNILSLFQRPCDRTNGGREGKRALAKLIKEETEERQKLESSIIEAILEAAEER